MRKRAACGKEEAGWEYHACAHPCFHTVGWLVKSVKRRNPFFGDGKQTTPSSWLAERDGERERGATSGESVLVKVVVCVHGWW